jgi:hypothetical protein
MTTRLSARVTSVAQVWVLEIPRHRLVVPIRCLEDAEDAVRCALSGMSKEVAVELDIECYRHIDELPAAQQTYLRAVAARIRPGSLSTSRSRSWDLVGGGPGDRRQPAERVPSVGAAVRPV